MFPKVSVPLCLYSLRYLPSPQVSVPQDFCSPRSMFHEVSVTLCLYSPRYLFPRSVFPQGLCSLMSIFPTVSTPHVSVPQGPCSLLSTFPNMSACQIGVPSDLFFLTGLRKNIDLGDHRDDALQNCILECQQLQSSGHCGARQ